MEVDKTKTDPNIKEAGKPAAPTEKDGPSGPVKQTKKESKRSKEKLEKVKKKCARKEKVKQRREEILKKRKGVISMKELDDMVSHARVFPSAYFDFKTASATESTKPTQDNLPSELDPRECILKLQISKSLLEKVSKGTPELVKSIRGLYINTTTSGLMRILSSPTPGTVSALNVDGTTAMIPFSDITNTRPTSDDVAKLVSDAQRCNGAVPTEHMVVHTLNHCKIKDMLPGIPTDEEQDKEEEVIDAKLAEQLTIFKDIHLKKDKLSQLLRTKNRHDFECISRNRFVVTKNGIQVVRGMNSTADGVMVSNLQEGGAIDVKYISIVNRDITIPDVERYLSIASKHNGYIPTSSDLPRLSEKRKTEETEQSETDPTTNLQSYYAESALKSNDVRQILKTLSREEFSSKISKTSGGMFVKKHLPRTSLNTVFYIIGFCRIPEPHILCLRSPHYLEIPFSDINDKDVTTMKQKDSNPHGISRSSFGLTITVSERCFSVIEKVDFKLGTSAAEEKVLVCKDDRSGEFVCVHESDVKEEPSEGKIIRKPFSVTVNEVDYDKMTVAVEAGQRREYAAISFTDISNSSPTPEETHFFMSAAKKASIPLPRMQSLSSLLLSRDQIVSLIEKENQTQQTFRQETNGMYIKQQTHTDNFCTIFTVSGMSDDGTQLEVDDVYSDPIKSDDGSSTPEPVTDARSNSPAAVMPSFVIQLKKEVKLQKRTLRVSDISNQAPLCQELQRYVLAAEKVERPIPNTDDIRSVKIQKTESGNTENKEVYSTDVVVVLAAIIGAVRGGIPWNHVSQAVKQTVLGIARSEHQETWDTITQELRAKINLKKSKRLELSAVEAKLAETRRQAEEITRDTERSAATFDKMMFEAERTYKVYQGRITALEEKLPGLYSDQQEEIDLRRSDITKMEETLDTCDEDLKQAEDRSLQLKQICDTYHENITKSQQQLLDVDDKLKQHFELQFKLAKKLSEMEVEIFKMENS